QRARAQGDSPVGGFLAGAVVCFHGLGGPAGEKAHPQLAPHRRQGILGLVAVAPRLLHAQHGQYRYAFQSPDAAQRFPDPPLLPAQLRCIVERLQLAAAAASRHWTRRRDPVRRRFEKLDEARPAIAPGDFGDLHDGLIAGYRPGDEYDPIMHPPDAVALGVEVHDPHPVPLPHRNRCLELRGPFRWAAPHGTPLLSALPSVTQGRRRVIAQPPQRIHLRNRLRPCEGELLLPESRSLTRMPVYDLETGRIIGRVRRLIVDPEARAVAGLLI